jgi:predicted nicotinamide N-methyase
MTAARSSRTAYGVKILNSGNRQIRRLKREGNVPWIHGHKFWNSSFLAMGYLKKNPLRKGARVLEVGCGWGLLGIFCAKQFNAKVTGIDRDAGVFPFLELHARVNGVSVATERSSFERITSAQLSEFDAVVAADICFWDELTPVLFNLVKRARRAGVGQVLIADPSRSPFLDLAARCEKAFPGDVQVEDRWIQRPVKANGSLLIVRP